jgi:hypothetical protein
MGCQVRDRILTGSCQQAHLTNNGHRPEWVFTKLILQILYWISEIVIHSRVYILDLPASIDLYYYILVGNWVVYSIVCLTVWDAGMPENYKLMMDYEYQGKKEEIHELQYIVSEIYILSIRFHKIFFVCEYQLCKSNP